MASITIRRLPEGLKAKLRLRAAQNGRSMEEEAREILKIGLYTKAFEPRVGLGTAIRQLFEPLGGVDLEIPPRGESDRPPPDFSE
jgi:antitoxin FitA